jgi:O-antigen/teichoic acid export membrane protein
MFSRMLATNAREGAAPLAGIGSLVVLAMRLVLTGTLAVAVFGVANARAIMDLRYTEHTEFSAPVFALLIGCFVAVCTTYVFGTLLTAGGNLKHLNRMAAGGAVLNIGINLVLIPRWQAQGAAMASLVTQVLMAAVQIGLAAKLYGAVVPLGLWARAAVYGLGLVGLAFAGLATGAGLLLQLGLFASGALVLALLTGMIGPRVVREALVLRLPGKP